jgi:hypothetical protein
MAFDFPNAPIVGQGYTSPAGAIYTWDGEKWGAASVSGPGSGGGASIYTSDTPPTGAPPGSIWWESDTGNLYISYNDGNSIQWVAVAGVGSPTPVIRSYLSGLTLSTTGPSANFSVAPGVAADNNNAAMMALNAAITKTTSAWAVGPGGALDTGAILGSNFYHVFLIRRPDTGVVDILISVSSTAPTLPANYTQFRRIGAMKTNVAGTQWIPFTQIGDDFLWQTPVCDINGVSAVGGAGFSLPSVPPAIPVKIDCTLSYSSPAAGSVLYVDHLSGATSPGVTAGYSLANPVAGQAVSTRAFIWTNNQSMHLQNNSTGNCYVTVFGYIDRRGRDN